MDTGGAFEKRGRALEDEFFYRVDKKLGEEMRAKMAAEAQKQALASACGLLDDRLLETLVAAKITAESLVALTLVPLVRVAWVDGKMDEREREAVLAAAHENECPRGSAGHTLLQRWLNEQPPESLFETWQEYTRALCANLPDSSRDELRQQIVQNVRNVAEAAGGILGIHRISSKEEAVLKEIEAVFS